MPSKRALPELGNPMIVANNLPPLEILVERRRLGQTNLAAKPGQAGLTNATKSENLGKFDYAHLRVPLPPDLTGSGVFTLQHNTKYPESYFLMRRSTDGYISATGMFKAAFPWASEREEDHERQHHKRMHGVAPEEVAGNIWVAPESALRLAKEYGLKPFIVALLDPSPIEKGSGGPSVTSPPKFVVSEKDVASAQPSQAAGSVRKRTLRSASPSKSATPARKIASPRKPKTGRKSKADGVVDASEKLNAALENGASQTASSIADSIESSGDVVVLNGASAKKSAKKGKASEPVTVKVEEETKIKGNTETTTTHVKVEIPPGKTSLPLPESPESMVAKAKEMVAQAKKLEETKHARKGSKGGAGKKRKADEVDGAEDGGGKKFKRAPEQEKREKVRQRAMIGITASLAVGALIPYFF